MWTKQYNSICSLDSKLLGQCFYNGLHMSWKYFSKEHNLEVSLLEVSLNWWSISAETRRTWDNHCKPIAKVFLSVAVSSDDMIPHFDSHIVSQFQSFLCGFAVATRWKILQPWWNSVLKHCQSYLDLHLQHPKYRVCPLCMSQRMPEARGTFGVG